MLCKYSGRLHLLTKKIKWKGIDFSLNFPDTLQNPKWNPATLEEVNMGEVESVFEPLGAEAELSV